MSQYRLLTKEEIQNFQDNGAIKISNFLNEYYLNMCYRKFEDSIANPSKNSTGTFYYNDLTSLDGSDVQTERLSTYAELVTEGPFADVCQQLLSDNNIFYYDNEIFRKRYKVNGETMPIGASNMTAYHQDTSYFSSVNDWVGFWICFKDVPKKNSLEVVKGSHKNGIYDPPDFSGKYKFMFEDRGDYKLPPTPVINNNNSHDDEILSWEIKRGDVIVLNPNCLHGNAPTDETFQERDTLVLRFFGSNATYFKLPGKPTYGTPQPWLQKLNHGDKFYKSGIFMQVRGSASAL